VDLLEGAFEVCRMHDMYFLLYAVKPGNPSGEGPVQLTSLN